MSDYPYLAAVLPSLTFGGPAFLSSARFLSEAEKWLTEAQFAVLESVSMARFAEREHPVELVAEYYRFERLLRQDVAEFVENRRIGREYKTRMFPTGVLKDHNPLRAERELLRLRWDWISSRLNTHHGDLHALIVYRIQTEILERLNAFDPERGKTRFEAYTQTEGIEHEVRAAS